MFRKVLEFGYKYAPIAGAVAGAIEFEIGSVAPDMYAYYAKGSAHIDYVTYAMQMLLGGAFGIHAGLVSKAGARRYEKEQNEEREGD